MAKKTATPVTAAAKKKTPQSAPSIDADVQNQAPVKETKARNSSVPPKAKPTATTTEVTDEMVAEHAYHMWKNGEPGDQHSHWLAAEKKLRGK